LTDNSLQSANKGQQESHAIAVPEKLHDAVVKFDTYRNLQQHRTVLPAIAWQLVGLPTGYGHHTNFGSI